MGVLEARSMQFEKELIGIIIYFLRHGGFPDPDYFSSAQLQASPKDCCKYVQHHFGAELNNIRKRLYAHNVPKVQCTAKWHHWHGTQPEPKNGVCMLFLRCEKYSASRKSVIGKQKILEKILSTVSKHYTLIFPDPSPYAYPGFAEICILLRTWSTVAPGTYELAFLIKKK